MLLALIVCHLFALSFANPFHKYPFVFLLDVGNEELERVNTEQIRVSTPGGSIALRYPAVGEGDTISHVRVSGIDFGTDLKANIVDGGPGYKYVVLVFMGNSGKPYDAVLTVQTVPDDNTPKDFRANNALIEENDPNDSAEDFSDSHNDPNQEYLDSSKAELLQSSSNVYNYAHDGNDDYSERDGYVPQKDIHNPYSERYTPDKTDVKDYAENEGDDGSLNVIPKEEEYDCDDDNTNTDDAHNNNNNNDEDNNNDNDDDDVNNNDGSNDNDDDDENDNDDESDGKVQKQFEVFDEEDDPNFNKEYIEKSADYEDSEELDQTFNDEEVHGEKYKYSNNNNYVDSGDSSAVAY